MEVKIYNSLTNKIEVLKPIHEKEISMYVCGPTVYNYVHIGNMRPVVVFDTFRKFLTYIGYNVKYVSNYTDVDDKIIKRAQELNKPESEITEFYIKAFEDDLHNINALKPNVTPRVTEYMPQIIAFIDKLVKTGYAYVIDGDVYFRVEKIKDYGRLSNTKIEDLLVGARIDENSKKESPLDFALWKKTDNGIQFESPWSLGRPGWHSECVVMINKLVPGGHIDIHGGGFDLKFPHHENEIAQEEALHNHKIANYWMHNGFINVDNVKMSKSLGNVKRAVDLLKEYGGNTVRFVLINSYYRTPVNFSDESLLSAKKEVEKIEQTYSKLSIKLQLAGISLDSYDKELKSNEFIDALCDDLNTPNALTEMYKTLKEANVALRANPSDFELLTQLFFTLKDMIDLLGLKFDLVKLTSEDIALYEEYNLSKANKDFEKSDQLRKILIERKIF